MPPHARRAVSKPLFAQAEDFRAPDFAGELSFSRGGRVVKQMEIAVP
jgi:hypothetical protein